MPDPAKKSKLQVLDQVLMKIEVSTAIIAGAIIFFLMFLVTAEVFLRRVFNNPIPGQQDITILSMVSFGVLCISYCYRQAGHIRMDLLLKKFTGRIHWSLNLAVTLIALLTVTAIWPGTWTHFLRAFQFGDSTFGIGLSTWPSKLAVPVGLGVLWLRLLLEIYVYGRLIKNPELEPIAVPMPADPREKMDA